MLKKLKRIVGVEIGKRGRAMPAICAHAIERMLLLLTGTAIFVSRLFFGSLPNKEKLEDK
jgi:hypothetical protein